MEVAKKWGIDVPFRRPAHLATDEASAMEVIRHAMESLDTHYDFLVLLQPTSPLRIAEDIDTCLEMCKKYPAPACVSITEPAKSPYWMYSLNTNLSLSPILERTISRRQDLPKTYALNGAVYVAEWDWFLQHRSFLADETLGYVMPNNRSLDIDSEIDLSFFKFLQRKP